MDHEAYPIANEPSALATSLTCHLRWSHVYNVLHSDLPKLRRFDQMWTVDTAHQQIDAHGTKTVSDKGVVARRYMVYSHGHIKELQASHERHLDELQSDSFAYDHFQ